MSLYYLLSQWWLAPSIGATVGTLAFFAGRLLFRAAPKPGWTNEKPADSDPFTSAAADERRAAARRNGNPVEIEISDPTGAIPPIGGWVVDRSLGGLCLEVDRPVPVGAAVKVKLRCANAAVGPIEVAVKSCRAAGPAWRLGCQFTKAPTFNILLLFG